MLALSCQILSLMLLMTVLMLTWRQMNLECKPGTNNWSCFGEKQSILKRAEVSTGTNEWSRQHCNRGCGQVTGSRGRYRRKQVPNQAGSYQNPSWTWCCTFVVIVTGAFPKHTAEALVVHVVAATTFVRLRKDFYPHAYLWLRKREWVVYHHFHVLLFG